MNFASLLFLYIFLPLTLLAYFFMPDVRRKNMLLVAVSLLFYAMGQPLYVFFLAGLTWLNYRFSLRIRPGRNSTLRIPVAVNLAVLLLLRYVDALPVITGADGVQTGMLLGLVGKAVAGLNSIGMSLEAPSSLMPIGLPFYFLTAVSYFLDIFHGKTKPEKNLLQFAAYMTMFPKLAQGPVVRYTQIENQLAGRGVNPRLIFEGSLRFIIGLSKKVLLADYCARTIAGLSGGAEQTLVGAWLCALMYMYRIYFDFSGCCDMAVGLGRIFGFRFSENFDHPYSAVSVTEFTKKWNMTLRSFVRDYVYIPLGGNRHGQVRQVMNCLAAWLFVGLWHGAGLNYVVWALYLFVFVMLERLLEPQIVDLPRVLRRFLTMLILLFGWVLFAHPDLMELGTAMKGMLGFGGFAVPGLGRKVLNSLPLILLCMAASGEVPAQLAVFWSKLCGMGGRNRRDDRVSATRVIYVVSAAAYACVLLWLCTVSLAGLGEVPPVFGRI